jgi:hypothetical protein
MLDEAGRVRLEMRAVKGGGVRLRLLDGRGRVTFEAPPDR